MPTAQIEARSYEGVPESELLATIYQTEIQPFLRPDITLPELQEHTTLGHAVTTMHLWSDQGQADRLWKQEVQSVYDRFWQEAYEMRAQYYEDAIDWLGIRKLFAEKSTVRPGSLILDIGGGSGPQLPFSIAKAKELGPDAQIGVVIVDNNPLASSDALARFRELEGDLYHAAIHREDFTRGLLDTLTEEIAGTRVRPSNLVGLSFYSITYQPLKFIREAVDEVFELGRRARLPSSMTIWATNPTFDTRIIAAKLPEFAKNLQAERGDEAGPIIARTTEALKHIVPHGRDIAQIMFGYPAETLQAYLEKAGYDVGVEVLLNGHSNLITINERPSE